MAVGRWSLRIPYRAALAKRLRYGSDIYARYGGDDGSSSSGSPALSRDPCLAHIPRRSRCNKAVNSAHSLTLHAARRMGPGLRQDRQNVLAARFARGFANSLALSKQRAQGMPGADCTRGLVCQKLRIWRTRAYRFSRNIPAFPAQWLYGLLRALPGERALLPPSPCGSLPAKLGASIAAPGPHDFAVRLRPVRRITPEPKRPSHPSPTHRDDRETPLVRPGCARLNSVICPTCDNGIFLLPGLDTISENQK